jgi:hypothetical protein
MIIHKLYEGVEASKMKADQAMRWLDANGSDWLERPSSRKRFGVLSPRGTEKSPAQRHE